MSERVVFVRTGYFRKPKHLVRTVAIKDGERRVFRKIGLTTAARKEHLSRMVNAYHQFKERKLEKYFCEPLVNAQGELEFRDLRGESLEEALLNAVLSGQTKEAEKLLDVYEDVLAKLSSKKGRGDGELNALFTEGFAKFDDARYITPAILDINFDNIILSPDGPTIFDYEWSFSGSVPTDYVLHRSLMWFGRRFAVMFREVSQRVPMTAVSENLVLPSFLFKRYKGLSDKLRACFELEYAYFQPYVSRNVLPKIEDAAEYSEQPVRGTVPYVIDHLFRLEATLRERSQTQHELEKLIHDHEKTIEALSREITSITNSKRYRVGSLLLRPLTVLKRLLKKS